MSFTNYLHKLVFPLIILLLAYLPLAGQTPYVFRHLKVENGLSNNNVKTILKDCEGFLWIGTANGLNRYDGYSFKGEFYQFNLSSCIRQQNSLTAQFVSFSLSNLANIFYPPQFLQ